MRWDWGNEGKRLVLRSLKWILFFAPKENCSEVVPLRATQSPKPILARVLLIDVSLIPTHIVFYEDIMITLLGTDGLYVPFHWNLVESYRRCVEEDIINLINVNGQCLWSLHQPISIVWSENKWNKIFQPQRIVKSWRRYCAPSVCFLYPGEMIEF